MKKLSESHKVSSCEGKFSHSSFKTAQSSMRPELRKKAMIYHCEHCRAWHIGGRQNARVDKLLKLKRKENKCAP